jgi:hypothetical protein
MSPVLGHLEGFLGPCARVINRAEGVYCVVWRTNPTTETAVVCTCGLSDKPQRLAPGATCPSKEPRIELISHCRSVDADRFSELLLDLSDYPFRRGCHLFWFQTLILGRPISSGSCLDSVLLTFPPYPEEFVTFYLEGKRRDLVFVVPISGSEVDFFRSDGIDALEERFERYEIDVTDLSRESSGLSEPKAD